MVVQQLEWAQARALRTSSWNPSVHTTETHCPAPNLGVAEPQHAPALLPQTSGLTASICGGNTRLRGVKAKVGEQHRDEGERG